MTSNESTITVVRERPDQEALFITVVVDRSTLEVLNAIDEDGVPIALTPAEEATASRIVQMGYDETGY